MVFYRKGSGIAGNPECVGVGQLVGGVLLDEKTLVIV